MASRLALLLTTLLAIAAARAENWPRFRGADGAGHASGPFTRALTDADIAWKADLPGVGHSSPVVWGDHVYLTAADGESLERLVLCFSAASGKVSRTRIRLRFRIGAM